MFDTIAARLADALRPSLIDGFVTVVFLFALSRIWLFFAPDRGQAASRWAFAVAWPAFVVSSTLFHFAYPESWSLSPAYAKTLSMSSIIIAALWLTLLLWRGVARLLRKKPASAESLGSRREWQRIAAITAFGLGCVVWVQTEDCRDEVRSLTDRTERLQKDIHALEVTEEKGVEFAEQRRLLDAKFVHLALLTPADRVAPIFLERFQTLAQEQGFEIESWSSARQKSDAFLREYLFTAQLVGQAEGITRLVERTHKIVPLAVWRGTRVGSHAITVRISLYEAPAPKKADPDRDFCAPHDSPLWLWPFTAKVQPLRDQMVRLCSERALHDAIREQVDDFQAKRRRLEAIVDAIDKVRQEQMVPALEYEPTPSVN